MPLEERALGLSEVKFISVWGYRSHVALVLSSLGAILAPIVKPLTERDTEATQSWLEGIVASELKLKELLECLELYKNLGDGFPGALRLYKEVAESCLAGKDRDMTNNRIKETERLASNNPIVFVLDPKPVL